MNYLIVMLVVILMINVSIILCMQMIFASCHLLTLQCRICHNYGAASDILFNSLKSVCMISMYVFNRNQPMFMNVLIINQPIFIYDLTQ